MASASLPEMYGDVGVRGKKKKTILTTLQPTNIISTYQALERDVQLVLASSRIFQRRAAKCASIREPSGQKRGPQTSNLKAPDLQEKPCTKQVGEETFWGWSRGNEKDNDGSHTGMSSFDGTPFLLF